MDTLLACTKNAAVALGLEDRIGTVAKDKVADLVVLNQDPLANPYALEDVHLVIKDGVSLRPEEISLSAVDKGNGAAARNFQDRSH
jgi:imidazolonepropionase-like amidohydrolase